jgi:TetR/AcrR family transcriptional regulator, ethionamide resistance regulator
VPPVSLPSRDLATVLNKLNETTMYFSFANEQPRLAEDHVVDTLTHVWVATIYGPAG